MAVAGEPRFRNGWIGSSEPAGWPDITGAEDATAVLRQGALLENAVYGFPVLPSAWFQAGQYVGHGSHDQLPHIIPVTLQPQPDTQPCAEEAWMETAEFDPNFLNEILKWPEGEGEEQNSEDHMKIDIVETIPDPLSCTSSVEDPLSCTSSVDPLSGSCAEVDPHANLHEIPYPHSTAQVFQRVEVIDSGDALSGQEQVAAGVHENAQIDEEIPRSRAANCGKPVAGTEPVKESRDPEAHILLRVMLMECARAVLEDDTEKALTILEELRKKAQPFGDIHQRLAHYFAEGLSARLTGTGYMLYREMATDPPSGPDMLKAFQLYGKRCASVRLSHFFCNQSILNECKKAKRVHIVDLGIGYGFHWRNLIQALAQDPTGAPALRITGIEDPTQFQEADTGRHLQEHARSCNLPLRYDAIRTSLENFQPSAIAREEGELLVVNCLFALRHIPDENLSVDGRSGGRQAVLGKLRRLRPSMVVYGDWSGSCNHPFFLTRFLEALTHYSALFEAVDASVPRTHVPRLTAEQQMWGREILNIVACEGEERVERQESYRRWQEVFASAGFVQMPLPGDVFEKARSMLVDFPRNHVVARDADWLLHGWKDRVLHAFSSWRPPA